MLPVRCFTCNKVLGRYDMVLERFLKENPEGQRNWDAFFQEFRIERYCCRKILYTHIDIYRNKTVLNLPNVKEKKYSEVNLLLKTD